MRINPGSDGAAYCEPDIDTEVDRIRRDGLCMFVPKSPEKIVSDDEMAMRTTEDLIGVRVEPKPEKRSNLRIDVLVPKGTPLLKCQDQGDRWLITVLIEGKRTELITFRNPLGKTAGERLGPRYGLHEKVKLKRSICGLNKDVRGVVVGYAALDSYHVEVGGKVTIVGGEYLASSKVTRCA